jgi:hypothetical protein
MLIRLISVCVSSRAPLAGRLVLFGTARWGFNLGRHFRLRIVALVPAAPLKDEVRGGDKTLNGRSAFRAILYRIIGYPLGNLKLFTALAASVFVGRHLNLLKNVDDR